MRIRDGFVTNSSSTNFLIISKDELTPEYLIKKLGFKKGSVLDICAHDFANDILSGIYSGLRWFEIDELNYENVLEIFGQESANKYKELNNRGFFSYCGHTNSDDNYITSFMTCDYFTIDEKDFYMNGQNCVW